MSSGLENRIERLEGAFTAIEPEKLFCIMLVDSREDIDFADQHPDVETWLTFPAAMPESSSSVLAS